MNDFKVIKQFGLLKKGDVLSYDEANNAYCFENSTNNDGVEKYRSAMIDINTINRLQTNGYLIPLKEPKNSKVENTIDFIKSLLGKYEDDLKTVQIKYANGEVPQCLKVEAETVFFNLNKALTEVLKRLEQTK